MYWKPDKYRNLKEAAKRKINNEIPEAAAEEEDEIDLVCDEGVKA